MTDQDLTQRDLQILNQAQLRLTEAREAQGVTTGDPVSVSDLAMARVRRINPQEAMAKSKAKAQKRLEASNEEKIRIAQSRYHKLMKTLGKRYQDCTLDSFIVRGETREQEQQQKQIVDSLREYCRTIDDQVASGNNVLLFGPKGTGKDHLATCVLKAAVMAGYTAAWTNGLDWFGTLRDGIDKGSSESAELSKLTVPTVLCISDPLPLFGELTQFQAVQLWRVIDRRYRDLKPTIVTLNVFDRTEAESRMGAALVDRLAHGALALFCNWESHRKNS